MRADFRAIQSLFGGPSEVSEPNGSAASGKTAEESAANGRRAMKDGEYERAIEAFKAAVAQSDEKNPWMLFELGNAYATADYIPEAFRQYSKAKQLQKTGELMVSLAALYQRYGGKAKEALAALHEAVELEPENAYHHHKLAEALRRYGFRRDALTAARVAVATGPDQAFYHYWLGDLLLEMGQYKEAAMSLKAAIELSPGEDHNFFLASQALWGEGKREEAVRAARIACDLDPSSPFYRALLVLWLRASGRDEEAVTEESSLGDLAPYDKAKLETVRKRFFLR
ncbi:MAG: tetratricopeptide repeat protein [Fimbriimonadaceae bacterium]|nr:tetratricopeptide repeat protein [Fimbriimonadaceae bacterium]QYK59381.1 MAG: tetratricopeptide repeat protein [Fimbriimonadaceae bacterium]